MTVLTVLEGLEVWMDEEGVGFDTLLAQVPEVLVVLPQNHHPVLRLHQVVHKPVNTVQQRSR